MSLTVFSILLIVLFQQQYSAQIAPPNDLYYEFKRSEANTIGVNPYTNSLRPPNANIFSSYEDDRSWKRALGPRPLRFG